MTALPLLTRLSATTQRLAAPVDLIAVAGDAGWLWETDLEGVAGRGVAARIELPDGLADPGEAAAAVAAVLTRIEWHRPDGAPPGSGPIAIGALPFDRRRPASLVVPARAVRRAPDGSVWETVIGDVDTGDMPARPSSDPPDGFTLRSPIGHRHWRALVTRALREIEAGRFGKVVLARQVVVEANRVFHPTDVLRRLRALYPSCATFSVDRFVGATPELLVARIGSEVRSHPLAGTVARSGDPAADEAAARAMLGSRKERAEHAFAVDHVTRVLGRLDGDVRVDGPSILALRNVLHLGTEVTGRLTSPPSALELVAHLHPTPAVAGTPVDDALAWLADNEGFDRGRYAGPVGWVDANGDGAWTVGIRSAELDGRRARLFAGVGLVAGSDPEAELTETQLKLQALLAAVVRP